MNQASRVMRAGVLVGWTVITAVWLGGCREGEPDVPDPVRPVKTMVATAVEPTQVRVFSGQVVAALEADLAFRVPGLLTSLPVREGQRVTKGEVIASLRQEEFQTRLASLQAQLAQSQARLRALQAGQRVEERIALEAQLRAAKARQANAQAEYRRFGSLVEINAVARSDFELRETQLRIAEAEVEAAQQALERSAVARPEDIEAQAAEVQNLEARLNEVRIQLADSTLVAPFDGVIAQRFVENNQNVSVGQRIVRIQDTNEITVAADVPESVMTVTNRGRDIVRLEAEFTGVPGRRYEAQIREFALVADPVTQTFRVRVAMPAPSDVSILPGMTSTLRLTTRQPELAGQILVPVTAIYRDPNMGQVVWVLNGDTVTRRSVRLGAVVEGRVQITEGLKPGERIAIAGVSRLREGVTVRDLGNALSEQPGGFR